MKKRYYQKCLECVGCAHYKPEGKRDDGIDNESIWKEACGCSGYAFHVDLPMAEICFDRISMEQHKKIFDKDGNANLQIWKETLIGNSNSWKDRHEGCRTCAFFGWNGYQTYYSQLRDENRTSNDEWWTVIRCRGYSPEGNGRCCDFITVDQWAQIIRTPIVRERVNLWEAFKKENQK